MQAIYELDINSSEFKNLLDLCPEISKLTNKEINKNIEILKYLKLSIIEIKEIIMINPFYLNRIYEDIVKLINSFIEIGIEEINSLIIKNPFILNKDDYEIKNFIDKEMSKGKSLQLIIEEFEDNPYIIDII